ncbi:hypothetical protein AQUCO_01400684v1 [Aquilegia coerulea]|uniref:Bifunctional inhibitor/plant lipid transfer protein/seed storage helical domain-containing protein n=1 Tax=Aquilegia coerulea TaxID=218851 RepID=A0A2G5DXL8_AQUCA|nr:hypothetical protein AQUCO_01400684v1 [Aquilegia coerulea]
MVNIINQALARRFVFCELLMRSQNHFHDVFLVAIMFYETTNFNNQVLAQDYEKNVLVPRFQNCKSDFQSLKLHCLKYLGFYGAKIPPSKECCQVIKKMDIGCICTVPTYEVTHTISLNKFVFVSGFCGKLPGNTYDCGRKGD